MIFGKCQLQQKADVNLGRRLRYFCFLETLRSKCEHKKIVLSMAHVLFVTDDAGTLEVLRKGRVLNQDLSLDASTK